MEGQNLDIQNQTKGHKTLVMLLLMVILVFVSIGILLVSQKTKKDKDKKMAVSSMNKPNAVRITPTPTLIPYAKKGTMRLSTDRNQASYANGENITVMVQATSDKSDIVGFDMVVEYDPEILEFKAVESVLPAFQAYSYRRTEYISVTMIKSLQETGTTIFDNTAIAKLNFSAKKTGSVEVALTAKGNDSTKFADVNAEVTYPETNKITLEIK